MSRVGLVNTLGVIATSGMGYKLWTGPTYLQEGLPWILIAIVILWVFLIFFAVIMDQVNPEEEDKPAPKKDEHKSDG